MIVKIKGGYEVRSESGKSLGKYKTRGEAKKRLAQVEMFKHMESDKADFSKLWEDESPWSSIMADGSAIQGKSESDAHSDAQRASDEAHNATKNATTSKEKHDVAGDRHEAAAKAHYEAAEKASTKKRIQYHMNLGDNHTQQAMNLRACKWESHKIEPVKIKEGGPGSGPHKGNEGQAKAKAYGNAARQATHDSEYEEPDRELSKKGQMRQEIATHKMAADLHDKAEAAHRDIGDHKAADIHAKNAANHRSQAKDLQDKHDKM